MAHQRELFSSQDVSHQSPSDGEDKCTRKLAGALVDFDESGGILKLSLPTDYSIASIAGLAPGTTPLTLKNVIHALGFRVDIGCVRVHGHPASSEIKATVKVQDPLFAKRLGRKLKEHGSEIPARQIPVDVRQKTATKVIVSWHKSTRQMMLLYNDIENANRVRWRFVDEDKGEPGVPGIGQHKSDHKPKPDLEPEPSKIGTHKSDHNPKPNLEPESSKVVGQKDVPIPTIEIQDRNKTTDPPKPSVSRTSISDNTPPIIDLTAASDVQSLRAISNPVERELAGPGSMIADEAQPDTPSTPVRHISTREIGQVGPSGTTSRTTSLREPFNEFFHEPKVVPKKAPVREWDNFLSLLY